MVNSAEIDYRPVKHYPVNLNDKVKSTTNITAGLRTNISANKYFSLQPSLSYVRKGTTMTDQELTLSMDLDYIEFQPLLRIQAPLANVTPYIMSGPSVGFLVGSAASLKYENLKLELDPSKSLETIEFCANIGLGMEFQIAKQTNMFVEGVYKYGISGIFKNIGVQEYNRSVQLLTGMMFDI